MQATPLYLSIPPQHASVSAQSVVRKAEPCHTQCLPHSIYSSSK